MRDPCARGVSRLPHPVHTSRMASARTCAPPQGLSRRQVRAGGRSCAARRLRAPTWIAPRLHTGCGLSRRRFVALSLRRFITSPLSRFVVHVRAPGRRPHVHQGTQHFTTIRARNTLRPSGHGPRDLQVSSRRRCLHERSLVLRRRTARAQPLMRAISPQSGGAERSNGANTVVFAANTVPNSHDRPNTQVFASVFGMLKYSSKYLLQC